MTPHQDYKEGNTSEVDATIVSAFDIVGECNKSARAIHLDEATKDDMFRNLSAVFEFAFGLSSHDLMFTELH